jgi:hypothetical protein
MGGFERTDFENVHARIAMCDLSCHVRDVLVHKIKTEAFLVNIVEHTILCHVLKDVAAVANDLR